MRTAALFSFVLAATAAYADGPTIRVSFPAEARATPATGRLVVYMISPNARMGESTEPGDGPFFHAPQPLFGLDATELNPGTALVVDDSATSFPSPLSSLPPGTYKMQAVLDLNRLDSSWRREPGNLYSSVVTADLGPGEILDLALTEVVVRHAPPVTPGVELFEVRSKLLSDFRGSEVMLRAGVMLPLNRDPARPVAAIYEIPGYGGDYSHAFSPRTPYRSRLPANSPWGALRENAAWIVLDPEGPNGHSLVANSDVNGPVADAVVQELIPALEAKYNLIAQPSARLLRGHSSGGWSSLWLALTRPDTFGACWSSSPDPVDFRRFQLVDLYERKNIYRVEAEEYPNPPLTGDLPDTPSYRQQARVMMTIRQENRMEEVLGPDNTSAQQWDSWQAVFGLKNERGNPRALFDPGTGLIDRDAARAFQRYDIAALVRREPDKYGPLLHQRVRLVVGSEDNYYLNESVAILKAEVEKLSFADYPEGRHGSIKIAPGDHGSVFASQEIQGIPADMVEHLKRHSHIPDTPPGQK